jgi:hypothetical protein
LEFNSTSNRSIGRFHQTPTTAALNSRSAASISSVQARSVAPQPARAPIVLDHETAMEFAPLGFGQRAPVIAGFALVGKFLWRPR